MEFIDFETRSLVDLKKVGAYAYARHPSTEIICMGYTKDAKKGNAVEIWTPYSKSVPVFSGIVCAWNAQFDYYIYKYAGVKKYGFTPVDIKYWYDLQAVAAYNNYPLSLDKCAKALGLDGKKSSGRTLINMLCKPSNGETFIEYDEQSASWFHEFYEYCRKDVQLLYDINRKLQVIPHFEMDTWRHTVKINERGLPMDRHELTCICEHVKAAQEKMDARTGFITGGVIKSVNQVGKLKEYLKKRLKINLKGVDKETITRLLEKSDLSKDVRILLETRKVIGLTSNKKFFKALEMLSNGAVHDTLQYYGAHTGRFSGRGFQLQNLNRKSLDNPEEIIDLLVTFNPDDIRIFYSSGEVLEITSKLVRSVIRAPEGHKFICADFSSIEAIAVPWVTGEWEMLDQFAKGFDLYKSAASVIFGVGYNAVNKELRQAGKLLVLACGYAGGYRALLGMAKNYGVKMDDVRAKELVAQFRYARPKLTNAWKKFEKAAFQAINKPGRWFTVEDIAVPIMMQRVADELWLQLPCGRVLKYRNINITKAQFLNFQMTCDVRDRRQGITGANLFQNTIQALCRDILVEAQHRLEKAGYPIFLSVHDECAAMVPDDPRYNLDEFIEIMTHVPTWANGLPIKADGWEGYRYKK